MSNIKLIEEFDGRFRSGNSIETDRIWLTKEQWQIIREALINGENDKQALSDYNWIGVK